MKRLSIFVLLLVGCLVGFSVQAGRTVSYALSQLAIQRVYDGYGSVDISRRSIEMSPMASTSPDETHAAFVVSQKILPSRFDVRFTMTTQAQLRKGSNPNPWEVGWFTFGYTPQGTFKYLILKPDGYGVELGEFLGGWNQNFLYTSSVGEQSFATGVPHDVFMKVRDGRIGVWVDSIFVMDYQMNDRDVLPASGAIGFYTEDARVQVSNVRVTTY